MAILRTNDGYIGIAKQTAKGTPNATPDMYIKFIEESGAVNFETMDLREAGDGEFVGESIKTLHTEEFGFKFYARPENLTYILGYFLGKDTVVGASDPYSHTLIRLTNGRKWLTIRKQLDTAIIKQYDDCKIYSIEINGEAGKPIEVTVTGKALTSKIDTTADTPSYEDNTPFVFSDTCGIGFTIDTATNNNVKSFNIKIELTTEELQTSCITINDIPDLQFNLDFSTELLVENTTDFWKKVNYNNTTSISSDLYSANFVADFVHTKTVANDRELQITIPDISFKPVNLNLNAEQKAQTQTLAGIGKKLSGSEMITFLLKNGLTTAVV